MMMKHFLLLSLFCALSLSAAAGEEKSYFTEEAVRTVDAPAVRAAGTALLAELEQRLPEWEKVAGEEKILLRRLELLRRGMDQLKGDLSAGDASEAICEAAVEVEELGGFRDYFQEVAERAARAPLPEKVLDVTEFGAKGDGVTDNTEAFRKALGRAMHFRGKYAVTLRIPDGVFYFAEPRRKVPFHTDFPVPPEKGGLAGIRETGGYLVIGNQQDLTVTGSGRTELLFDRPLPENVSCIKLGGCDNVTVKNLSVDYKLRPFTQGVIKEADPENLSLLIETDDPQAAMPGMPHFKRGHAWSFTPEGQFLWDLGFFMMIRAEAAGPQQVRYFFDRDARDKFDPVPLAAGAESLKKLHPGMKFVHVSRRHGGGVQLDYCRFCTVENVTVYASQAMAFLDTCGYATTFRGCRIARKPGRMISANGDGFHMQNQMFGCAVVDCEGEYLFDDGLNSYARHAVPERKRPSGSYSVSDSIPVPGTLVGVADPSTGQIKALARCSGSPEKGYTFTPEIHPVTKEMIRSGEVKDRALPDSLVCFARTGAGFVALNTRFAHNHGQGFVVQSPHSMLEDCSSSDAHQAGYFVGTLGNWGEYSRPRNVVVRNCESEGGKHSFMAFCMIPGNVMAPCRSLRDLLLEGNRFKNCRSGETLLIHNTERLTEK